MPLQNNKIAHLREIRHNNKCELCFHFNYTYKDIPINVEIKAVRRTSENLESLRQHIINKVNYYVKQQLKVNLQDDTIEDVSVDIVIKFLKNKKEIKLDQKLSDIIGKKESFTFKIGDETFKTYVNCPCIEEITLPEKLYINSALTYVQLKASFTVMKLTLFEWFVSTDKINWVKECDNCTFMTTNKHLGKFVKLKCTPKNDTMEGMPYEVASSSQIEEVLDVPEEAGINRHKYTTTRLCDKDIRVISYNILSEVYTTMQFAYCQKDYLALDYRKQLLLKEILGYNADILCFQEVDEKLYKHFLRKKLQEHNFGSVFHRKGNRLKEGLMIIFNKDRFKLQATNQIVYSDVTKSDQRFNFIIKTLKSDNLVKDLFLKQATSLQYCRLIKKDTGQVIVVGNTHLYYHKDAGHIRLLQVAIAMEYLRFVIKESNHPDVRLIFCGDFNSQPMRSAYYYLTKGTIDENNPEVQQLNIPKKFQHSLNLTSACGTPEFTNYTDDFKGCLDYIFIQKEKFTVKDVVPMPEEKELQQCTALPSKYFPSDHIALIVDLSMI